MDVYVKMEEMSETVYDCDTTVEKIESDVAQSTQTMLNLCLDSWDGDSQRAFLDSYYKWVENSNTFINESKVFADYIAESVQKVDELLKKGQALQF